MTKATSKEAAAFAALEYIRPHLTKEMVLGVGVGSTVNYFIDALASIKYEFDGAVAASEASAARLKQHGITLHELNNVSSLRFYIDGADEFTTHLQLIKGGGAALTREKIVAAAADEFICIADESKQVSRLGTFPLPVEVIPMARSYVARELVKMKGNPEYRQGVVTDNGNHILDIWNLDIIDPLALEKQINQIAGVVTNGIFAQRAADIIFIGSAHEVKTMAINRV